MNPLELLDRAGRLFKPPKNSVLEQAAEKSRTGSSRNVAPGRLGEPSIRPRIAMNMPLIHQPRKWALILCLLLPLRCAAEQYVELTAEIEINDWHYWFLEDEIELASGWQNTTSRIFPKRHTIRCVVGTNTWMMEGDFFANAKATYWFTGTNIIRHSVITKDAPDSTIASVSERKRLPILSPLARKGEQSTKVYESVDGNPGRPLPVRSPIQALGKIPWLAVCSGSFLKRDGRQIFPPSDRWKETIPTAAGFPDKTTVFEDGFGLPKSIKLFATKDQLLFQYQVRQATNVLGWNFPLEFYLVQYAPTGTNGWELQLSAKGKVTSIKEGTKPEIPAEVRKAVEK